MAGVLSPSVGPSLPFAHPPFPRKLLRPSSSSPSCSTISLGQSSAHLPDPRQFHLRTTLNPFKWAKDETSGLFEHFTNEERYRMYTPDGYNLAHLQRQIARTFQRKPKPPPAELLAGVEGAPLSGVERSRLNLLRWLSSASCRLFDECEDSVEVNDVELDELVRVAGSAEDAGVNALRWLVKWSGEGRKYSKWAELVTDMREVQEGHELQQQTQAAVHRRRVEQLRREEELARRLAKEKVERWAALRRKQQREQERRAEQRGDSDRSSGADGHSRRQSDSQRTRLPAVMGRRDMRGRAKGGERREKGGGEGEGGRPTAQQRASAEEAKESETSAEAQSSGETSAAASSGSPPTTRPPRISDPLLPSKAKAGPRPTEAAVD